MWKIFKKIDRLHLFLGLMLIALVTMGAAIPSHITRLDSLVVTDDSTTTTSVTVGENDVYIEGTLEVDGAVRFDSTVALGSGAVAYTWPTTGGTADYVLRTDGTSTLTWVSAGSATAWSDIGDATADSTITFANDEITKLSFADVNEDMFTIEGIGAFADVSVVKIEQKTGDATDGTVLEVVAADANVDPLVISASGKANALVVGQNTGVVTIAGVAEATSALIITAGDILITDGDLHVDAGDCLFDEDVIVIGTLTAGTIAMDAVAAVTATQTLTLDGHTTGGVTIGSISEGNITLGDTVIVSDGYNMTIGEGTLTIDNDAVNEWGLVITADAAATAGAIQVVSAVTTAAAGMAAVSITADAVTTGDLLLLDSLATGMTTGNFINAFDGSGTVFEVGLYGATTIAGNASTDVLIVTAGDIQITNGDIDLDSGNLMVDTTADLGHNLSRNYAGAGTAACLTVTDAHASGTNAALSVVQGGTNASEGILITHSGDGAAIEIVAGAARTGNVIDIAMANQVAQNGILIDGAWTGASDKGMINLNPTGTIASGASCIFINTDTGTPAASGFAIEIDDDSADGGDNYALLINSAHNEGLHVELGVSLFAEAVTFTAQSIHTGGINADGDVDIDLSAETEEVDITTDQQDFATGSGLLQIHGDHAGNTTGDMSLIRLVYQGNGIANDSFIECVDNSTGAAANGDTQFKVDSSGDITTEGTLTVNGATAIGDGATQMYGFVALPVDGAAGPVNIEIADSGKVYYNSQACQFNLPAAAAGLRYTFVVANASLLTIEPDGTDYILVATDTAGDKITSSTVADTVTLIAVGATNWYIVGVYPASTDWADGGA